MSLILLGSSEGSQGLHSSAKKDGHRPSRPAQGSVPESWPRPLNSESGRALPLLADHIMAASGPTEAISVGFRGLFGG